MKEYYEKSLQRIKEIGRKLTEAEWNEIAMRENCLSSESLQYISGTSFNELCIEAIA